MESLHDQQPQDYQRGVNAFVAADPSLNLGLAQERERKELLEEGSNSSQPGCINSRRERECSPCLRSQDSPNPSVFQAIPLPP